VEERARSFASLRACQLERHQCFKKEGSIVIEYSVIGGNADNSKFRCDRAMPQSIELMGSTYIAIEFPITPDTNTPRTTVFMLAGTQPGDAIKTWRARQ
jgi:hypothetical protein